MNRFLHLAVHLLLFMAFFPCTSAQSDPLDSLKRIYYDIEIPPAKRKQARDEIFRIERERGEATYAARPQQILLKDAKQLMNELKEKQDSIFNQLIKLASADTLANIHEKMEATRLLADWMDNARIKQNSVIKQFIELIKMDTSGDLHDYEKESALRFLARSQNKTAYTFLLNNIGSLSTTDDYNNTKFWFYEQEPADNWALFPKIIRLISTRKLYDGMGGNDIITITLLLDKIVQDPSLLVAILNLYAQKDQNEIFIENKKAIVELLQDMH